MAKKKESATAPTAVSETIDETAPPVTGASTDEPKTEPRNLIGAAIEHMTRAAAMLRSKGGKKAESCAHVATQLDRWVDQLEKLNE
jgi:hypothetical protein